jgi:hypothetical protein
MGLIFRTQSTNTNPSGTSVKGSALAYAEMDSNLVFLSSSIASVPIAISGSTLYSTNPSTTGFSTSHSIFLGGNAGYNATNAIYSNFIGTGAGNSAESASYSVLIGYNAGYNISGGALGIKSNNIIIGTNITLPNGTQDSINLGGIIFATGSYNVIAGNPFSGSVTGAKVGIGTSTPTQALDVSGSVNISNVLILPYQNPLPSGKPTGSIATSGSGATFVGLFLYNGTSWVKLSV